MIEATPQQRRAFFAWSDRLDHEVLRPLSHIRASWEMMWDHAAQRYEPEDDSFAADMNDVIDCVASTPRPERYHDDENIVANYLASRPQSGVTKVGNRWVGANYSQILEQGGFHDIDQRHLRRAATGRVCAAIERGQLTYDDVEDGHRRMLAEILTIILYYNS